MGFILSTTEIVATFSAQNRKDLPTLVFPRVDPNLKRSKREWVIPTINIPENDKGPFPHTILKIQSNKDKETRVFYSITGEGADQPPAGTFVTERESGLVNVTRPLDREKKGRYQLMAYAVSSNGMNVESPTEINIFVMDMNDNKPYFTQTNFTGYVSENVEPGTPVTNVTAADDDEPGNNNALLAFTLLGQYPQPQMFAIDKHSGLISTMTSGLDRESVDKYILHVQVADYDGEGMISTGTATVTILINDRNDNAPQFIQTTYTGSVRENLADQEVTRLNVTDADQQHSMNWNAVYSIISGNEGGLFSVKTDAKTNDGILKTAKGLDFEANEKHILMLTVINEVPFSLTFLTSTATVTVMVLDENEAPMFEPPEKMVQIREDLKVGSSLYTYTAIDPDKHQSQTVKYSIGNDPRNWLECDSEGNIHTRAELDREALPVDNNKYRVEILAYDNGNPSLTGTGTLILDLEDVNDNGPEPSPRSFKICNQQPPPQLLLITDKDTAEHGAPFTAQLIEKSTQNWTISLNESGDILSVNLRRKLEPGLQQIYLRLTDSGNRAQVTVVEALVCNCLGDDIHCQENYASPVGLPVILAILGSILALLILLLLLLLFIKRKKKIELKDPLLTDDDMRANIFYYDEEGGGEEDQDYDLSQLHRGLDAKPEIIRNDIIPTYMPAPQYHPLPADPNDIGNFITDNLKAADDDPTAPPYDSLLVFDFEGGESDAGSLSSLNSSISGGEQDYDYLNEWGPKFKKLSDMYGGEEED